jgi:hypothetical protein
VHQHADHIALDIDATGGVKGVGCFVGVPFISIEHVIIFWIDEGVFTARELYPSKGITITQEPVTHGNVQTYPAKKGGGRGERDFDG